MKRLIFIFISLVLVGCTQNNASLKHAELSVAYVINPRLQHLPEAEIRKIVYQVSSLSSERFSLDIRVKKIETINISELFDKYRESIRLSKKIQLYMLKPVEESKEPLFKGFLQAFAEISTKELIDAVKNQTNADKINITKDRDEILRQIAYLHIDKLMKIKSIPVKSDDASLIQNDLFNEYMVWDYILEHQSKYDLIITNQLIASAEAYLPTVHTSMRGGITSGFAGKSKAAFGGTVLMSTFPFTNDSSFFKQARGTNYSKQELAETIAYTIVHEFGHLFKYRKHYYDHSGCIMRPAPGLHYLEWINEIKKNGKCDKNHELYWQDYYSK